MEVALQHFQDIEEISRKRKASLRGLSVATTDEEPASMEVGRYLINAQGDDADMKYHGLTIKQTPGAKTWYTRLRLNGKQEYISGKTQKQVISKVRKLLNAPKESITIVSKQKKAKSITFGEFYVQWLDIYKRNLKESTKNTYKVTYNNVSEKFRKLQLADIDTYLAVKELDRVSASRMKQRVYVLMKDIFSKALRRRIIEVNPLEDVPTPKYESKEKHVLTVAEQKIFEETCKKFRHGDAYLVALWQGLRRGELLMLRRNDIDFEKKTIRIDESITDKSSDTTTKNKYSNRTMPLFDKTAGLLKKFIDYPEDERIFKIDTKTLSQELDKIFAKAELRKLTLHELRHTFVTRCKEQNVPEHIIQKWVGHQIGSKITSTVYTHVTDESSSKYSDLLNNI